MRISIIRETADSETTIRSCRARVQSLVGDGTPVAVVTVEDGMLALGKLAMNPVLHTVVCNEKPIDLNPLEFRLLEYLLRRRGSAVSRNELMRNVWHYTFDPATNIIETCVSRLRAKIRAAGAAGIVSTVRGAGYRVG